MLTMYSSYPLVYSVIHLLYMHTLMLPEIYNDVHNVLNLLILYIHGLCSDAVKDTRQIRVLLLKLDFLQKRMKLKWKEIRHMLL